MAVTVFDRRIPYAGNGVATVFDGPRAFLAADLSAFLTEDATGDVTALEGDGVDYSVAGLRLVNTVFTLTEAPATGFTLTLLRTLTYTQETRFTNQGAFYAELHEDEFDRGAMCDQQLADLIAELRADLDGTIDEVGDITQELITIVNAFDQRVTVLEETLVIEFPATSRQSFLELSASYKTGPFEVATAVAMFTPRFAFTLLGLRATLGTAQTAGDPILVDLHRNGVSVLSERLRLSNGVIDSELDEQAPTFIDGGNLLEAHDRMTFDIDQVGDGTARWLQVQVWGYQTLAVEEEEA